MSPEIVVDDLPGLQRRLAGELESRARAAIAGRGAFSMALPGGSIAEAFFPTLAMLAVDWSRTDFFWIDERAVAPGDPDSNYGLASRLWLTPAGVPASRVHRLRGEAIDLEQAARMAAEELIAIAGDPPRLDVVLAGAGEDGHVASLFAGCGTGPRPGQDALVAAVYDSPKPPPRRLTLTMPALSGAGLVVVAALGRSKAVAVRDALGTGGCTTPLAELLRRAKASLVLIDREAALC